MSALRPVEIVGSVADLPASASGPRHLVWWGNIGFMAIEGTGFLLAAGAYLYLATGGGTWPPAGDRPPDLIWGVVFTLGLLASEVPNLWVLGRARAKDARGVRVGTVAMAVIGALLLVPRAYEFAHLNVPWYRDAYGSALWMLLVLHTTHVVTDLADTVVISVWLHTHAIGDDQFADVEDNANYWTFVVACWLPIYLLIYWYPRWA